MTEDWDGDGKPEVENEWDIHPQQPDDTSFRGKLARTTDPSGVTDHSYDERGRTLTTRLTVQGKTLSAGSRFDAQDREYLHVYPDGSSLRIHYDARGQVVGYGGAVQFVYDADGVELSRAFNTGVTQATGYDDDRRLREMRVRSGGGEVIEHLRALALHAVVFTHDLDFGILVAMAGELGPSIMQARTHATTRPDREQIPDRPRLGSRCSASSKPRHPTRHPRRAVIASDRQRSWVDVFVGASRARRGRRRALGFAVVSSP